MKKENIKQTIKEIDATMSMENMPLTSEDKNRLSRYLNNEITIEKAINEITQKHTR